MLAPGLLTDQLRKSLGAAPEGKKFVKFITATSVFSELIYIVDNRIYLVERSTDAVEQTSEEEQTTRAIYDVKRADQYCSYKLQKEKREFN